MIRIQFEAHLEEECSAFVFRLWNLCESSGTFCDEAMAGMSGWSLPSALVCVVCGWGCGCVVGVGVGLVSRFCACGCGVWVGVCVCVCVWLVCVWVCVSVCVSVSVSVS